MLGDEGRRSCDVGAELPLDMLADPMTVIVDGNGGNDEQPREAWDEQLEARLKAYLRSRQEQDNAPAAVPPPVTAPGSAPDGAGEPSTSVPGFVHACGDGTEVMSAREPGHEAWWPAWAEGQGEGRRQLVDTRSVDEQLISADGGVRKRTVRRGAGPMPELGCTVEVNYMARLRDSMQVFDCAHVSRPLAIVLGEGATLPGLEMALMCMEKGEEAVIHLTSRYAYGDAGCPPRIPPRADVDLLLRLAYVNWPAAPKGKKQGVDCGDPLEKRQVKADQHRDAGNDLYKRKAYRQAARSYNKGLAAFNGLHNLTEEEQDSLNSSLLRLHSNLAAALMELGDYPKAIEHARKALSINPGHEKALYRLGRAHEALQDHYEAAEAFRKLLSMRTDSRLYRSALHRVQRSEREAQKQSIFVGIFNQE